VAAHAGAGDDGEMPPKQPEPDEGREWTWDPSLYAGSARYYTFGRVAYPAQLAEELVTALPLDGSELLLDVGCGPGSLTLLLAPYVAAAIGVDADADMLVEASRLAAEQQVHNVRWRRLRGEDLPADLPRPQLVTFAQSFHWMDRHRVAAAVHGMIATNGALVHVGAETHQGVDGDVELPRPRPPRAEIDALVQRYLGPRRRAGQGHFRDQARPGEEDDIYRAAGFHGPQQLEIPGRVVERTADEVAASVYSLSSAAPHLFGDRLSAFDAELRQLLAEAGDGGFSEEMRSIRLSIWRPVPLPT
jgi:SAM-dependent methyltransferase